MTFHIEDTDIVRTSIMPEVRQAAESGSKLIEMWPLTDAKLMDNDAKYAETLQVRITQTIARVMTGEDVTIPDAEFVYEGADEIPGRPQNIVDALLSANDACDEMSDYSQTGDTALVMGALGELHLDWNDETIMAVSAALENIESLVGAGLDKGESSTITADPEAVAQRLALLLVACDGLLGVIENDDPDSQGDDADSHRRYARRALPMVLYANELCERLSIPRLYVSQTQYEDVLIAHAKASKGSNGDTVTAFARALSPLAIKEWNRHRDDLLWDPDEAKKKAKEEDERKSREALKAKFAHVPENKLEGEPVKL